MHPEHPSTLSRRDVLKSAAAGALLIGVGRGLATGGEGRPGKKPGVALQLYSIRNDCGKDFDKALEAVAAMGFKAVEFAGYHNYKDDAKGLRKKLEACGLKAAATHIGTGNLVGDALPRTIEFHKEIGCRYLCVPGDRRFTDPEGSKELAEIFNEAAAKLEKVKMFCGYHNHTKEFTKHEGKTYWDLFAERTVKDVVLQQDIGWTVAAGHDPAALVRRYPGRSAVIHCKPTLARGDEGRPIIGEDSVPWKKTIQACMEVGGTRWLTIEQEAYLPGKTPMECVELSLAGLKKILAGL